MVSLPDSEESLKIYLAVSTEYRRVTDGRTDRRTDILGRHSPRYAWHRAVKMEGSKRLSITLATFLHGRNRK